MNGEGRGREPHAGATPGMRTREAARGIGGDLPQPRPNLHSRPTQRPARPPLPRLKQNGYIGEVGQVGQDQPGDAGGQQAADLSPHAGGHAGGRGCEGGGVRLGLRGACERGGAGWRWRGAQQRAGPCSRGGVGRSGVQVKEDTRFNAPCSGWVWVGGMVAGPGCPGGMEAGWGVGMTAGRALAGWVGGGGQCVARCCA